MFTNELYLTIVRSGMRGALGAAEGFSRLLDRSSGRESRRASSMRERVNELEEIVGNITRGAPKIRRSAARHRLSRWRAVFGTLRVFQYAADLRHPRRMRLPRMGIRNYVGTSRLHFSQANHAGAGAGRGGEPLRRDAVDQGVSALHRPGMLDGLCR